MSNILDDLFQWAAQQPSGNISTVGIAITVNRNGDNVVSYAEGSLKYYPEHSAGWLLFPPTFNSDGYTLTQYFSNNRYPVSGLVPGPPFDSAKTDSLAVVISRGVLVIGYTITIESKNYAHSQSFTPSFDQGSGVISYGSYSGLMTISLCNKNSFAPPH